MSIRLEQLTKRYDGQPVVSNVTLDVADRQLCVLLGPSGSGKSTILRLIAGLAAARRRAHPARRTRPRRRAGPEARLRLRLPELRAVPPDDGRRERRVRLCACAASRAPSGRGGATSCSSWSVSPASAAACPPSSRAASSSAWRWRARSRTGPRVLLLDEPFGALDARIRLELRRSLHGIQRELGITTLFVTHDQEEAFELGDRIAVLDQGRLVEEGPPEELYLRPQTEFAATFLGGANLWVGESTPGGVRIGPLEMPLSGGVRATGERRRLQVLVRPEDVAVRPQRGGARAPGPRPGHRRGGRFRRRGRAPAGEPAGAAGRARHPAGGPLRRRPLVGRRRALAARRAQGAAGARRPGLGRRAPPPRAAPPGALLRRGRGRRRRRPRRGLRGRARPPRAGAARPGGGTSGARRRGSSAIRPTW